MADNIVTALLRPGGVTTTRPLYQYDYGQILRFTGQELPAAYEVHFANDGAASSTTSIGGPDGVQIPDAYLQSGAAIRAWLYLHTGPDDGETRFEVYIPVKTRAAITDAEPTPVQQDAITQAIAASDAIVPGANCEQTTILDLLKGV